MRRTHHEVTTIGRELAQARHGVISRRQLNALGIDRFAVRTQTRQQRWEVLGHQAIRVLDSPWHPTLSPIVVASENAPPSAWVDGASALLLAGLSGWSSEHIDLSMALNGSGRSPGDNVRLHRVGVVPARWPHPVARSHAAPAVLRAAAWAATERQAATLISMSVQQRLVQPRQVMEALTLLPKLHRRRFIREVLADVAGGSESMGELDFLAECRRRGIPLPDRQVLRVGKGGKMFLDVVWEAAGLCVEVDGAHHYVGDVPVADALRQNEVALLGLTTLRIPRLALRITPEPFFAQIKRFLATHTPDVCA